MVKLAVSSIGLKSCAVPRIYLSIWLFQAYVHKSAMDELKRIIDDSEIMQESDNLWPPPDRVGRQVSVVSMNKPFIAKDAQIRYKTKF